MRFPLGSSILALMAAAIASGVAVWREPALRRADVEIWSFDEAHADLLRGVGRGSAESLLDQLQARTGLTADIRVMGQMGENIRLGSAFMSGKDGASAPDLCEIEISAIGPFLRPPVDDIGLLPLNDFLKASGWEDRIVKSRFAPWSKVDPRNGRRMIYGIPEDVHPVTILYRKDLFDRAGIDIQQATTWGEFQRKCEEFETYWANHGRPERRAIALPDNSADELVQMLLQRHVNLIDSSDGLHFTDAKVLETLVFYCGLVAGPGAVGGDVSPGVQWTEDLRRGNVCAVFAPDWKAQYVRDFAPELSGNVAMMALPRFEAGDAPTSTLGGTMVGICRSCRNPREAWKCLEFLYLSPEAHRGAIAAGDEVLPAEPQYWTDSAYRRADGFFAGASDALYVELAPQIPERIVTPFTYQAELALAEVLHRGVEYVAVHGNGNGLRQACAGWLAEAQAEVRQRIEFGKFAP